ncbi:MAG: hypothetical protein EOM76_02570 [Sphingobacteriia bacterium]|nr:hypothetical protein [Sphingobacteriia bacterium]
MIQKRNILFVLFLCGLTIFGASAERHKKIGLVLSGGGALGYAHIGAIQALEEHDIYPEYIAGTSMGAIIGALYADGIKPAEMLKLIQDRKMDKTIGLIDSYKGFADLGLSTHDAVKKLFSELMPHNNFDSLKLHYYTCVTNLDEGIYKIVGHGDNLKEYVAASASIPGVFSVEVIDGVQYVDGGVLNNIPSQAIRNKCDILIGVDVVPYIPKLELKNIRDVLTRTVRAAQHQNSINGRKMCDYLVESDAIRNYNGGQFNKYLEIYQYGYKTMMDYIKAHPEMVATCKRDKK